MHFVVAFFLQLLEVPFKCLLVRLSLICCGLFIRVDFDRDKLVSSFLGYKYWKKRRQRVVTVVPLLFAVSDVGKTAQQEKHPCRYQTVQRAELPSKTVATFCEQVVANTARHANITIQRTSRMEEESNNLIPQSQCSQSDQMNLCANTI